MIRPYCAHLGPLLPLTPVSLFFPTPLICRCFRQSSAYLIFPSVSLHPSLTTLSLRIFSRPCVLSVTAPLHFLTKLAPRFLIFLCVPLSFLERESTAAPFGVKHFVASTLLPPLHYPFIPSLLIPSHPSLAFLFYSLSVFGRRRVSV